ncbi:MAG: HIRAN domain-containing protein [Prevotella sp.]|jgi:hypothetical protein|nr:HIRAN domain-containing protein [Prevotella sp.]
MQEDEATKSRIKSYRDKGFISYNMGVKGLYYRDSETQRRAKFLRIREEVFLKKEDNNPVDKYAVQVYTSDNYFIGYTDKSYSQDITKFIDNNIEIYCFISKVTSDSIPYVYMDVYYDIKTYHKIVEESKLRKFEKPIPDPTLLSEKERRYRIKRLKENIKRSEKSLTELIGNGKDAIAENAIARIKRYQEELNLLEEIKKSDG